MGGRAFLARASPVSLRQLPVPVASRWLRPLSRGRPVVCQLVALCAYERSCALVGFAGVRQVSLGPDEVHRDVVVLQPLSEPLSDRCGCLVFLRFLRSC